VQIGELARRSGLTVQTLRYYEDIGVLARPTGTTGRYQDSTDDTVSRLQSRRHEQPTRSLRDVTTQRRPRWSFLCRLPLAASGASRSLMRTPRLRAWILRGDGRAAWPILPCLCL
jgi:hypothetical protein